MFFINVQKWWQTIKIWWGQQTAYRLNFFLQVIGPPIVFFCVKASLWKAIFNGIANQKGLDISSTVINGMTLDQMISYHAWAMIVGFLSQGMGSFDLSNDIRLGKISTYLIYPFNFWEYHTAGFLAFQTLQIPTTLLSLLVFSSLKIIALPAISNFILAILVCFVISLFWFSLQYFIGLLAFWLEETWIMRVMINIVTTFLSGAIIPVSFFPEQLQQMLVWSPFPYMIYWPTKIFLGQTESILFGVSILIFWTLIMGFINTTLWKRGLRLYTAAGM